MSPPAAMPPPPEVIPVPGAGDPVPNPAPTHLPVPGVGVSPPAPPGTLPVPGDGGEEPEYLFIASGEDLDPDIAGLRFFDNGEVENGEPVYESEDGEWYIWSNGITMMLGPIVGSLHTHPNWQKNPDSLAVLGEYPPGSEFDEDRATGTVTISAID